MIFDFFKIKHECTHNSVSLEEKEAYCPDCGALIQNKWFIIRCGCCGIKRTAIVRRDNILPASKFCTNCGSAEYYIQELETLNFTDIHYAVFKKTVIHQDKTPEFNQVWTEENAACPETAAVKTDCGMYKLKPLPVLKN